MVKTTEGKKVTPRQAAKLLVVQTLNNMRDSWPQDILEDDLFTTKEECEIRANLLRICNQILFKHLTVKGINDTMEFLY